METIGDIFKTIGEIFNWFSTASKEEIDYALMGLGILTGIVSVVIRVYFLSFSLGGLFFLSACYSLLLIARQSMVL